MRNENFLSKLFSPKPKKDIPEKKEIVSPEKQNKEPIVTGYSSIFDNVPTDPEEYKAFKKRITPSFQKFMDAWTLPELYAGVKEIIDLPDTDDEREMRKNISKLCSANIPLYQKSPPDPVAFWADTVIYRDIFMRYMSITSKEK